MKNINKFISGIITEAALDSRIQDGMVNLKNIEHIQVVAEAMYDACEDESIVNEFVDGFVDEGKYPDRQAYNKDGWLVTFPSSEYKQRAIKKGTHYGSDPTHGKGGMNLYYKKRGKQKRQTQQAVTSTEPVQPKQPVQKKAAPAPDTKKSSNDVPRDEEGNPLYSAVTDDEVNDTGPEPEQTTDKPEPTDIEDTGPADASQPTPTNVTPASPAPAPAPAPVPVPVPVPAPNYVALSIKFADSKGWTKTPYGEWRDSTGNTAAVISLSGEVVPVKSVERDELKLIADKNKI